MVRVVLVGQGFIQLVHSPDIILQVLLVLTIDRVYLLIGGVLVEQRATEEAGESIKGAMEMVGVDFEEVIGVLRACVRVGGATVLAQVARVLVFVRELLRAHEQQVFTEVSQARQVLRVLESTDVDV